MQSMYWSVFILPNPDLLRVAENLPINLEVMICFLYIFLFPLAIHDLSSYYTQSQDLYQPLQIPLLSNTTLEGTIDTRSTIQGRYPKRRVPLISYLMNTVTFITDISPFG